MFGARGRSSARCGVLRGRLRGPSFCEVGMHAVHALLERDIVKGGQAEERRGAGSRAPANAEISQAHARAHTAPDTPKIHKPSTPKLTRDSLDAMTATPRHPANKRPRAARPEAAVTPTNTTYSDLMLSLLSYPNAPPVPLPPLPSAGPEPASSSSSTTPSIQTRPQERPQQIQTAPVPKLVPGPTLISAMGAVPIHLVSPADATSGACPASDEGVEY